MENIILKIRDARESDVQAIHNILEISFADYFRVLGVKIPAITETHEDIKQEILSKNVYVATVNNFMLSGTIRYEIIGNVCYISRFGVLPKWQSSGTGGMLISHVENFCKANNIPAIALFTATKLSKQIRYYYGQGFFIHSTSTSRGYIRGLLVKELGGEYCLDDVVGLKG